MHRRTRRPAAAAASVALASFALLLGACASGSGTPSADPSTGDLPTGAALTDWADGVIPENTAGGTAPARVVASFAAGDEGAIADLGGQGESTISIGCLTTGGAALSYELIVDGESQEVGEVICGSAEGDAGAGAVGVATFDGTEVELRWSAAEAGVMVLATEPADTSDR